MPRGGTAGHKPRRATGSTRDFALGPDYQLTAGSVAAIDKGIPLSMGTNAAIAGTPLSTPIFAGVFSQDIAHQAVPCGDAPDIGASEYCGGVPLVWPGPSDGNSCPGAVGTPTATGGASSTGGDANANTGGTEPSGGVSSSGGDSSIVAQGGSSATGGAMSSGTGGAVSSGTGGAVSSGTGGAVSSGTGGAVSSGTGGAVSSGVGSGAATPRSRATAQRVALNQ